MGGGCLAKATGRWPWRSNADGVCQRPAIAVLDENDASRSVRCDVQWLVN
jgi:hypothetical protein